MEKDYNNNWNSNYITCNQNGRERHVGFTASLFIHAVLSQYGQTYHPKQDGRTPKELGNRCALDKSTITSLLGKMEQQGLIRREVQPMDKRSVRIYLTQEGLEKGVQVQRVCSEVDASIVEGLSAKEQETLISSLRTILETLEGRTHA